MENTEKFLPIGTVVLLKGATKKVLITGYCMRTVERPNKIYDYCGCPFPEGMLKSDLISVFDHEKIDKVFHQGYVNEESKKFFDKMKIRIEEYNNNKNKENE